MGACASREKDLLDKSSLNSKEMEKCKDKFKKLQKKSKSDDKQYLSLEGFQKAFPENQEFSEKLYKWIRSQTESDQVDLKALVLSVELLTKSKSELYVQSFQFKNLEQYQLLLLISISNSDLMKQVEFKNTKLAKIEISFLQAGIFIKEIINMLSRKHETLSVDDDLAAKLLINNIFGDITTNIDLPLFCNKIKFELPLINKTIRRYFSGKFTNSSYKIRLPVWDGQSQIINDQILGIFHLSTNWLNSTKALKLMYSYDCRLSQWNYEEFSNSLSTSSSPTLILFRHTKLYDKHERHPFQQNFDDNFDVHKINYHFGFYCGSFWNQFPQLTGDQNSSLFSIVPQYNQFSSGKDGGQGNFAVLSKGMKNLILNKRVGLGIGESGQDGHKLWIDGQDLKQSYVNFEDQHSTNGYLCDPQTSQLNLEVIEVWALEQIEQNSSLPVFRQTQNNHITSSLNDYPDQLGHRDTDQNVNYVLEGLRKSQGQPQSQSTFQVEQVVSDVQKK